jgi:hypothetical protein
MAARIEPSDLLSKVQVAKPCPANWREMRGDARVRHCTHCSLNVYNISELSREEAADLIETAEGRLCVRYFTRSDGTIITKDCPQALRATTKRLGRVAGIATMVFGFFGVAAIVSAGPPDTRARVFFSDLYDKVLELFGVRHEAVMGDVTFIPPSTSPSIPVASPPKT